MLVKEHLKGKSIGLDIIQVMGLIAMVRLSLLIITNTINQKSSLTTFGKLMTNLISAQQYTPHGDVVTVILVKPTAIRIQNMTGMLLITVNLTEHLDVLMVHLIMQPLKILTFRLKTALK